MDERDHVQLGPYTLKRRIGAGGMAEVWMAERVQMGAHKNVAIKLLNSVSRESQEHREMFLDEARLSMALNHSSIVQVFDVDEYAGECFITMEWVDGLNLSELNANMWERGELLPLHVSTYIIGEVLRALDHAHNVESHGSTGIVHRDISPQNVMLSVGGEVKIMDFGVARFSTEHTTGKFLKGKLRYMAPEQANLQSRDPIIDLFAVGAILYELIEGRRFRAGTTNDIELLNMAMTGSFPPLTKRDEVPDQVLTVLDGLLESNPTLRIGSARGALRMLSEWSGYRNAALELEAIVARHRTGSSTASSSSTATSVSAAHQIRARMSAHLASESGGAVELVASPWRGVNASTETTLEQLDADAIDETSVGSIWSRRTTRATRGAAIAVGLLALALGSSTLWFALDQLPELAQSDQDLPVDAEPSSAPAPDAGPSEAPETADEPVPLPPAEPPPTPSGAPAAGETQATDETPPSAADTEPQTVEPHDELVIDEQPPPVADLEPEPEPEPELAAPTPPKPKQAKKKVSVTLSAGTWRFVRVKIGSREFTLPPATPTELREGSHRVKILDRDSGEWVKAGRIRLDPDHSYEIRMLEPFGVRTIELD